MKYVLTLVYCLAAWGIAGLIYKPQYSLGSAEEMREIWLFACGTLAGVVAGIQAK